MSPTRAPEVENSLLKCDLRGRDQDEEADPVEGAKIQVLCAGVCYGTDMGQQLSGHRQLDGTNLTPLYGVFYTQTQIHVIIFNQICILNILIVLLTTVQNENGTQKYT